MRSFITIKMTLHRYTKFSTSNDTHILKSKNRKYKSFIYIFGMPMTASSLMSFLLSFIFFFSFYYSRLYWSVDIWTAGMLGRVRWMMVEEPLYHGKHSRLLKILVSI